MMKRKKFEALAAASKSGMPTGDQLRVNGGMLSQMKTEVHEYDSHRPKRPVMSRYGK